MNTGRIVIACIAAALLLACSDLGTEPGAPATSDMAGFATVASTTANTVDLHYATVATGVDNGPQDGIFDSFAAGNLGSIDNNGFTSFRTAFEFDLSQLPPGAVISSARLTLVLYVYEGTRSIQVHGYVGDGSMQLSDFARNGLVGTATANPVGGQTIVFDVTSFLTDLQAGGEGYAGFNVREEPPNLPNFTVMDLALGFTPLLSIELAGSPGAYDCAGQSQIPPAECQALAALYRDTNGDGWTDNSGWLQTSTPCSWYGVSCIAGHVWDLRLRSNGLTGPIPVEISDLSKLETLDLYSNQLTGTIPAEFGSLSNLRILWLSDNQLTGPIPVEIGNLANLQDLSADRNRLTGPLPAELGNVARLLSLVLYGNQLTGSIPVELANLSSLEILRLENNQLTGPIPPELANVPNLHLLFLSNNQLTGGIPSELGDMTSLNYLWLFNNALTGIVPLTVAVRGGVIAPNCYFIPGNPGLFMPDVPAYRAADLDHDGRICQLQFTGAAAQAGRLKGVIAALHGAGVINDGQTNALVTKTDQAIKLYDKDKFDAAIEVVEGFIQQVNDLTYKDHVLTPAQAEPLLQEARWLVQIIQAARIG